MWVLSVDTLASLGTKAHLHVSIRCPDKLFTCWGSLKTLSFFQKTGSKILMHARDSTPEFDCLLADREQPDASAPDLLEDRAQSAGKRSSGSKVDFDFNPGGSWNGGSVPNAAGVNPC